MTKLSGARIGRELSYFLWYGVVALYAPTKHLRGVTHHRPGQMPQQDDTTSRQKFTTIGGITTQSFSLCFFWQ